MCCNVHLHWKYCSLCTSEISEFPLWVSVGLHDLPAKRGCCPESHVSTFPVRSCWHHHWHWVSLENHHADTLQCPHKVRQGMYSPCFLTIKLPQKEKRKKWLICYPCQYLKNQHRTIEWWYCNDDMFSPCFTALVPCCQLHLHDCPMPPLKMAKRLQVFDKKQLSPPSLLNPMEVWIIHWLPGK